MTTTQGQPAMAPPEPPPDHAALNLQFAATVRGDRRARVVLTALIGVVVAGSIILLWLVVMTQQSQLRTDSMQLRAAASQLARDTTALTADTAALRRAQSSACRFNRDLGGLADLQSQALTVLISDARLAFRTRNCAGQLPPPTASFVYWARFYHLPVIR